MLNICSCTPGSFLHFLPFNCCSIFCWCILFYIVKMSGLSHWYNFLVLMLLFGYAAVYSLCCCESHNSHPFISFHSDKNLYQLFVDLILTYRQQSSGLNSSNEITSNLEFEIFFTLLANNQPMKYCCVRKQPFY